MFIVRFIMQTLGLAFGQLRANKARALLTALGIIVGIASVTSVIGAMTGLRGFVLNEFEKFGSNRFFIDGTLPPSMADKVHWLDTQLTIEEVHRLRDEVESIELITPMWWDSFEVRNGEFLVTGVRVTGAWPEWHEISDQTVIRGREMSSLDNEHKRHVCLINEHAIEELGLNRDPVGDFIFVGGRRFLVIGVIETKEMSAMFGGGDAQTEVYVPFETCKKMAPHRWIRHAEGLVTSTEETDETKAHVRHILRRTRGLDPSDEDTFFFEVVQRFVDGFNQLANTMTAIAAGVVAISLLVGGVGIMNIMLVSVSERTREIGLRKAVGAQPIVILLQFLIEAIVLCVAGGIIGVILGQIIVLVMQNLPDVNLTSAAIPPSAIVLALGFCTAVGVLFGMFPAIKAARLNPIDALRHE